ncbi:MAG: SLATT domain-containing protein, partial [Methylobacter sp.]
VFSLTPREANPANEAERLNATMKTTAVNRYNASNRLKWQGKIAFATTTILSLGLIFIPLMQLANVPLALKGEVLNAIQIFLAVSILVYSVIIGTARYDVRSEQLNDCGDKLKELIRELRREQEAAGDKLDKETIRNLQIRYSAITTDVENHTRNDYRLTLLQTEDMYKITGTVRLWMWIQYWAFSIIQHIPSICLLIVELIFILDMFGATKIFSPFLNGTYTSNS